MKNNHCLIAATCLLFSSCATKPPAPPPTSEQAAEMERQRREYERDGREYQRESRERFIVPPRMGMTREQVRAEYGRPLSVSITPRAEVWTYSFNATDARPSSPFHDTSTGVRCTIVFHPGTGKISTYTWAAANPVSRR